MSNALDSITGVIYLCNALSCILSRVWLFATPWTVAHQAPLSKEFSRQEHCSGLLFPSPGALPDPGTEPKSLKFPALAGGSLPRAPPGKPCTHVIIKYIILLELVPQLFCFSLCSKQRYRLWQKKCNTQISCFEELKRKADQELEVQPLSWP